MDWRAVNFDRNRARAFLVTAGEGSLSAAARTLGMTQPTLGRQVTALELLDHVRAMGAAAGQMSLAAGGQAQTIDGTICITASEIYMAFLLPPIIARLRQESSGIEVEIVASNATVDLRRREADIALRSFRPTQGELIAAKVGDDPARLCAATV